MVLAVLARPWLWWTAITTARRLGTPGWWRSWPPLPRPPEAYWRFRMETAFGSEANEPLEARDVVAFLRWCRRMPG